MSKATVSILASDASVAMVPNRNQFPIRMTRAAGFAILTVFPGKFAAFLRTSPVSLMLSPGLTSPSALGVQRQL